MKLQIALKTQGQTPSNLVTFAQSVIHAMTENDNFPDLLPPLKTLEDQVAELKQAIANGKNSSRNDSKVAASSLRDAANALNASLKLMASCVEYYSNNDQTVALSSGFHLKRLSQRNARGFEVDYGEYSGIADLRCPRQGHASYIWEYCAEPLTADGWLLAGNSLQSRFRVTDLLPGTRYWFRVSVVDKKGQQPPYDAISVMMI